MKMEDNKKIKEHIEKITKPIFEKSLQETPKNHVSVGSGRIKEEFSYAFYNPHNARYYFKFNRKNICKKPRGGGSGRFIRI